MTQRHNSNWPFGFHPASQNQTVRFARRASRVSPCLPPLRREKLDPRGFTPPWGWPITLILGIAFCLAFLYLPTTLVRFFGV